MPSVTLALKWDGDLNFSNAGDSPAIELHSGTPGVSSPPQALAYAVMACMAMDVVHVIQKGRHALQGMTIDFEGQRADEHPRRFVSMALVFHVIGDVPDHVVDRAIELSRTKYCSVWNTVRPDVEFTTRFDVRRP